MKQPRVSDNDTFITLIRAAEQDRNLAQTLIAITSQPETERKIRMLQLAQKSRDEGAPSDFVSALLYLGDNDIARRVSEHLSGKKD